MKNDHDRFPNHEFVALAALVPAALNDVLYKAVDPNDAEVVALAETIERDGLLDPLIVTLDNVIISGHRRRVACALSGRSEVPVQREAIYSTDPDFPRMLVVANRQRVKSVAEVVREEIILVDPQDAHRELVHQRAERAKIKATTIELRGTKHRAKLSSAKVPFLTAVKKAIDDLEDFWPLSVRQVHYNLLNDPPLIHASKSDSTYCNNAVSYKALIALLTQARLQGHVPFEAIGDDTRPVCYWDVYANTAPFVRHELGQFMDNYYRDLLQSQPNFVVVVGEKNTVEPILRPVASEYTVPLIIGRGYSSIPPRYEIAKRFEKSGKDRLILIVVSDHDPEGDDIPHSLARSIRDDFGIRNVAAVKAALTHEQVVSLRLSPNATAKEKSSRRSEFVRKYGNAVYELEAVPPVQLQEFLRSSIESVLDMEAYRTELAREGDDAAELKVIRNRARAALAGVVE